MNALYRHIFLLFVLGLSISASAQNEYEVDQGFKTFQSKKEIKSFSGKRKFNVHFGLGYNLSTVFGKDVLVARDTMSAIRNRIGLNSYEAEQTYFPYAAIDMSFNFSRKISLSVGFKYNKLGWREVAKYEDLDTYFRYVSRYDFHYTSAAISLQIHPTKHVTVYGGHTFSFLVKNDILQKQVEVFRGDTIQQFKELESFESVTGVKSVIVLPQFFIGTHLGFDRLRFNLNVVYTPSFIKSDIKYNNIAIEAGVIFKLLRDYERKF